MSISKTFNKMLNSFEDSVKGRREAIQDIEALDEIREITSIGASLCNYMRENQSGRLSINGERSIEYLKTCDSFYFDNAYESYKRMDNDTKHMVRQYARAAYKYKPEHEKVKNLAVSGGGGKGQFYIGALKGLEDQNVLQNIETFAGTSAGALTAIPLALGMNTDELLEIVKHTDFRAFMIEGRNYNSSEKRQKQKHKGISAVNGKATQSEIEKVTNIINSIKVGIESCMDDSDDNIICDSNGRLRIFFNVPLEKSLETEFKGENFKKLLDEIWESENIKKFCTELQKQSNDAAENIIFKEPKDILMIGLSFALNQDYVEHYFSRKVHERVRDFTSKYSKESLVKAIPRMENESNWADMSMSELGDLARTEEGKEFGFRDLVIGVTRTRNSGKESALGTLWKQINNTQGLLVSSDISKSDDVGLSHAPISTLARMSMSIPFEFNQKKYGNSYYVDGGLHHNLPTHYFDRQKKHGFDKETLSIMPFTGGEIEVSNTVQEAVRKSDPFNPVKEEHPLGWLHANSIKSIWNEIKKKAASKIASQISYKGNNAYQEMGIRESFRNILVNTQNYSTLSFRALDEDLVRLNELSRESVNGIDSVIMSETSPSIFDSNYNSVVRLFEQKIVQHSNKDCDIYKQSIARYCEIKKEKLSENPLGNHLTSKKAKDSIEKFIAQTKNNTHNSDDLNHEQIINIL